MDPCLFLPYHLFCLSHNKTRWTMLVDNEGLKYVFWGPPFYGHSNIFFPWCKPKWSQNEFNNQPHIPQRPWHNIIQSHWSV